MSHRTLDEVNLQVDPSGVVYHGGDESAGNRLRLPMYVRNGERFDDRLVLALAAETSVADPDFTVEECCNVVAVGPDCDLLWTVDAGPTAGGDVPHYRVHSLGDRLVTRGETGTFAGIDLETGAVEARWDSDEFVVGGMRHEFDREVNSVCAVEGVTLVQLLTDDGCELYGFGSDGRRLWHRVDDYGWGVDTRAATFHVYAEPRKERTMGFDLDPETGTVVEVTSGPDDLVQGVLDGDGEGQP